MSQSKPAATAPSLAEAVRLYKLDHLIALLRSPEGAAMQQMMMATDWQAHSIRGAMAGALRRKGFIIESTKTGPERRWKVVSEASK